MALYKYAYLLNYLYRVAPKIGTILYAFILPNTVQAPAGGRLYSI